MCVDLAEELGDIMKPLTLSCQERQAIKWLFEHEHQGIEARVEEIEATSRLSIKGGFWKDGEKCGSFERSVQLDGRDKVSIEQKDMRLDDSVRGNGVGREWAKECFERYPKIGIHKAEVFA